MMRGERPSGLVLINKKERVNGWSWPPHPYQLVAWFFVFTLPLVYFGALVPRLPSVWFPAGCIIPGSFLFAHVIFHLVCMTLDPADPKIRLQKIEKAREFSRKKHKHVIENDHCYICQVDVGKKSKHCALCNKCISEFDHHCKWLNNCIGGQNYKLFISCLSTALASAVSFIVFCLYLFIMYFKSKESVMGHEAYQLFGHLDGDIFVSLTGVMIILLLIAVILLGHLLCFHIFLMHKRLSTYDFIVQNRQANVTLSTDAESVVRPPRLLPCKSNSVEHGTTESSTHHESIEMQKGTLPMECRVDISNEIT